MSPVWRNNVTFDPFTQPITLLAPDGTTPVTVSLADVMVLQRTASYQNISQGVQTGAASILLLALLLITGKEKRRSHVFIFNALALLLIAIRGILSFVLCTGPLFNFYRWELMYYGDIGGTKSISAAGEVLSFLITVTIEISLAMQVRIVCCNLATFKRVAINITNGIGAFVVCGLRFALMVLNITWGIVGLETSTRSQFDTISTFASATNIALVISIGISTIIFCAKLGFAIRSRRSLGMKQFGPMQIIFVMGCQTMIGPRTSPSPSPPYHTYLTDNHALQSSSPSSPTGALRMSRSPAPQPPSSPSSFRCPPYGLLRTAPTAPAAVPPTCLHVLGSEARTSQRQVGREATTPTPTPRAHWLVIRRGRATSRRARGRVRGRGIWRCRSSDGSGIVVLGVCRWRGLIA